MTVTEIVDDEIQSLMEEIHVFHGSDREFDDFDMNKVGSGDGKSLGGWGIYFSDDENVSRRYYTKQGFVRPHVIRSGRYFDLDAGFENYDEIIRGLQKYGVDDNNIEEFQTDYVDYAEQYHDITNKQVYDWLSYVLGGEKEASLFLKSLGYLGNTMIDKWNTDARNYIVFDTKYIIE